MSLNFMLFDDAGECFSQNITHNLGRMADAAGIYKVLWRPEEIGITKAHQCIHLLSQGLIELVTHRKEYEKYNSPNGWGMYGHFVPFVSAVLTACADYPNASVSTDR